MISQPTNGLAWSELSLSDSDAFICRVFFKKHITEHSKQKGRVLDRNKWVFLACEFRYFQRMENSLTQTSISFRVRTGKTERNSITTQLVLNSSSCCFCFWHDMNIWGPKVKNLLRKQQIIRFFQLVAWTLSFSHAKSATKTKGTENLWAASWWWWWWWRKNEWMNEWQSSQEGEQEREKEASARF